MTINLEANKVHKPVTYEDQVRETIREKMISGELVPGERLPSTRIIARSLGTNPFTVRRALGALQNEGLLISYPRKGIFVQKHDAKLTCVGVYCGTPAQDALYTNAVNSALRKELHQAGIELDVWVDPRPKEQHGEPWVPLIKAAEQRRFQAFIGTEVDLSLLRWQQKLPVPMAFLGAPSPVPNSANYDVRQFVEISLRELARQGCRSVGLLAPIMDPDKFTDPDGTHNVYFGMVERFMDVAGDLGLTVKNDWMRIFAHRLGRAELTERFGYEEFLKLWSQPEKLEGLLVFDDVVARGAITAIREKQVRVPEDLKLVLSKSESIDLFCPMPATFVVTSERDMARVLIEQVQKQFCGESCERILLPFQLAAHINPEK